MVKACHNTACWQHSAADDYLWLYAQPHKLMKYYILHKFGVSHGYNMFAHNPWHSADQGAANVALCYIALSDTLIDTYHSQIQPSIFHDPTLTLMITKSIKALIVSIWWQLGLMVVKTSVKIVTAHFLEWFQWLMLKYANTICKWITFAK